LGGVEAFKKRGVKGGGGGTNQTITRGKNQRIEISRVKRNVRGGAKQEKTLEALAPRAKGEKRGPGCKKPKRNKKVAGALPKTAASKKRHLLELPKKVETK